MEVSQNRIWWYYNLSPIMVAITPENCPKVRIIYGYYWFHNHGIFSIWYTMTEYGWHLYMWPDLPEHEMHRDMNPWTESGGTMM